HRQLRAPQLMTVELWRLIVETVNLDAALTIYGARPSPIDRWTRGNHELPRERDQAVWPRSRFPDRLVKGFLWGQIQCRMFALIVIRECPMLQGAVQVLEIPICEALG